MNMKSLKTQFIGAIAMVLVAAIAMGSSTYAWFSMNTKVTVTGMTVKTKVNDNLLIAADALDSTAKKADNLFGNDLTQEVKGILEPVSTTDGENFWYTATSNVKASGDAIAETYLNYNNDGLGVATDTANYDNAFSENYGVTKTIASSLYAGETKAQGYVDYVFQLKAVTATAKDIHLTKLDLTYGGAADPGKAYRIAIFVQNCTSTNPVSGVGTGTLKKIYSESGAANFTDGKAVVSGTTLGTVSTSNLIIGSTTASSTTTPANYYKVVVRLWLEGEDTTCNNATYMALTDQWELDLEFSLVESDAAQTVTNITKNLTTA